ncbi:type II toxin-antitoxin system VapC family toxin (plasmid) [Rhizobium sullae]|uniref:PIN domain-containing protein n=1 Tax=Rhizobium sullae TaxID=50338 RepID=A0A2N0DBB4_RHISU|nr:type II toxin-antitoxin system VapC family toxin [Rhizobium sullae]PKA43369.1 PIN domain-containing protein [Rhizobium sullae]UWU18796.1 type II toxin-antitoxin system VapC family toxin [Rhizobium sullae]
MFVDASVIIALLLQEQKWDSFARALDEVPRGELVTSVLAVWEAAAAIYRKKQIPMAEAEAKVQEFLRLAEIAVVSITLTENTIALSAFEKYGRHRYPDASRNSALNLADCFHYAAAKAGKMPILTKDAGFTLTDLKTIGPDF